MDWMNQLSGLLNQYQGGQNQQASNNVNQDFDRFSRTAPNSAVAEGLSAAFRSNTTPPFGNMVSQLFANSSGMQRASLMNTLLAAAGPMVLQQVMSRMSGGAAQANTGGGLAGLLGNLTGGGGQPQITPEMADQIPPQAIEQIAAEAEKQDPSIIDRVSGYYAENPEVVKGLGAVALTVALAHLANRHLNK